MKTLFEILQTNDLCEYNQFDRSIDINSLMKYIGTNLRENYMIYPYKNDNPKEFSRENLLNDLREYNEQGFEFALNGDMFNSNRIHNIVYMYNWILDDMHVYVPYQYKHFGLPYFKMIARKYGFYDPLGKDLGNEDKYSRK